MSRIGKRPVAVGKAEASVAGNVVTVKGPKGTRTFTFDPARVTVSLEEGALSVKPVEAQVVAEEVRHTAFETVQQGKRVIAH